MSRGRRGTIGRAVGLVARELGATFGRERLADAAPPGRGAAPWLAWVLESEELPCDAAPAAPPRRSWLRWVLSGEELPLDAPAARPRGGWRAIFTPEPLAYDRPGPRRS